MNIAGKDIQKKYLDHVSEIKIITDYWDQNNLINKYGKDLLKWSIKFKYYNCAAQVNTKNLILIFLVFKMTDTGSHHRHTMLIAISKG